MRSTFAPFTVLINWFNSFKSFCERNLVLFGDMVLVVLPFISLIIGEGLYKQRDSFELGSEVLVLFIVVCFAFFLKSLAHVIGTDKKDMPVPSRRFTNVNGDEVSISNDRVQELLLYMADLEDWFDREGYTEE